MFATFKYNETTKDHEYISRSDHPSSADDKEYTRTACDLCRARKLKCSGDKEGCNRCLSTSSACTYTFSSGIGAGKKRLRKVPAASFKSSRLPQKPSESPSRFRDAFANAVHDDGQQGGGGGGGGGGGRSEGERQMEHPGFLTSPEAWSNLSMDMDALLNVPSDGGDFLTGDAFTLCPGKHMSKVPPHTPMADRETAQITGREVSAVDAGFLALFELGQSTEECNSPSQRRRPASSSVSLPALCTATPSTAPSTASPTQPPSRNDAPSSSSSATSMSDQCGCLFSMLQTLEDLGTQTAASTTASSTDSLFLCLEQGIKKCQLMLSCPVCDTSASSPILVVTIANHLIVVVAELVHRFINCQSRDTVPTVFQFGRYCVEHPALRTQLLKSMIELHVRDLNRLVIGMESNMAGKQGSMLDDAKSKSKKMQQTLQDFGTSDPTISV